MLGHVLTGDIISFAIFQLILHGFEICKKFILKKKNTCITNQVADQTPLNPLMNLAVCDTTPNDNSHKEDLRFNILVLGVTTNIVIGCL